MANEGKQIPASYPVACVIGDDWGFTVTFEDDIATDTFAAKVIRGGIDVAVISCTPNTGTKSVALALTDSQTSELSGVYNYYFERTREGITITLIADTFEAIARK